MPSHPPPDPEVQPRTKQRRLAEFFTENAPDIRRIAEQVPQGLTLQSGAPSTVEERERVWELWKGFCDATQLGIDECPSGDQVMGFLGACIEYMKPRITDKDTLQRSSLMVVWRALIRNLQFRHRDFNEKYTPHDLIRIKEYVEQAAMQGKLLRGRYWARQWVGFATLQHMVEGHLQDCIENGVRDWDGALLSCLAFVLQYALCARAGDITRSHLYTGKQYLVYNDVTLTLKDDLATPLSVQDLKACIHVRFTKGDKQNDREGRLFWLRALENPSQNAMCVIKLILIMALRTGQTHGHTIQEVLQHARRRSSLQIRWRHPDLPLMCAHNSKTLIRVDKPMPIDHLNATLKKIANDTRILGRVTTHAIRRGALRDVAHVPASKVDLQDRAIGASLAAHSRGTFQSGLTEDYLGDIRIEFFNLSANHHATDKLNPKVVSTRPKAKPKLRPAQIDQFMTDNGMDPSDHRARARAARRLREERMSTDQTEDSMDDEATGDGDEESVTDAQFQVVEDLLFGDGRESSDDAWDITLPDEDTLPEEDTLSGSQVRPIHLPPDEFVTFFASINSVLSTVPDSKFPELRKATGGSRAEPTRFLFKCDKGRCVYTTQQKWRLERHQGICKGAEPKALVHICNQCNQAFASSTTLRIHKADEHSDKTRQCSECGQEFQTSQENARHFLEVHDFIEDGPIRCPCAEATDPECSSPSHLWAKWGQLRAHLTQAHHLTKPQMVGFLGPRILGRRSGMQGRRNAETSEAVEPTDATSSDFGSDIDFDNLDAVAAVFRN